MQHAAFSQHTFVDVCQHCSHIPIPCLRLRSYEIYIYVHMFSIGVVFVRVNGWSVCQSGVEPGIHHSDCMCFDLLIVVRVHI
jgi:hypothetical protein